MVDIAQFNVFLELQRRNDQGTDIQTNRIPLLVTEVGISTNKTVPNMGIPFSGAVRGESTNLAFDVGLAQKTVSLTGILLDQEITKNSDGTAKTVTLTSFEMAQLIHSYVDSSAFQDDQAMNKLLIFYPSRVDNTFSYRTDSSSIDYNPTNYPNDEDLPRIPFNWKNRAYDNAQTILSGNTLEEPSTVFDVLEKHKNQIGLTGFIRSFTSTIAGEQYPSINFTLEFEEARVIADNFFS